MPVATCPIAKLAMLTISNMMFIGLASWPLATSHIVGGGSVAISFGPYCESRRSTSSESRPRSASTPSRRDDVPGRQRVPARLGRGRFDHRLLAAVGSVCRGHIASSLPLRDVAVGDTARVATAAKRFGAPETNGRAGLKRIRTNRR